MPSNRLPLLLFSVVLSVLYGSNAYATLIEGVVLTEKGPLDGAVVTAYSDYTSLHTKEKGIVSTAGEKPGRFSFTLPEGKYYLVATGTEGETDFFGYHGLNPVNVQDEYMWIPLMVQPRNTIRCEEGIEGLGGHFFYKGKPLPDSTISVYTLSDEPFRGMGYLTQTVFPDGSFWFDLVPGTYVVFARKRFGKGAIGPVKRGDLLCYFSENPVEIPPGQSCDIDLSCFPRDAIDDFFIQDAVDPRGKRFEKRRAASLKETEEESSIRVIDESAKRPAFISGRVTDLNGMPLKDMYIAAFPADEVSLFQMYVLRLRTEHMTRTNEKGFFWLEVKNGSYYLVARDKVGDAPLAGEYYGIYQGDPNHSIELKPNEVKSAVNIIAVPLMTDQ